MKQIAFKLPAQEVAFLEWYSKRKGIPVGSLYRQVTLAEYTRWKLEQLLDEYKKGILGLKQLCDLGGLSLLEAMLVIERKSIEPPIPADVDDYTDKISEENIAQSRQDNYKRLGGIKRKAPEVEE